MHTSFYYFDFTCFENSAFCFWDIIFFFFLFLHYYVFFRSLFSSNRDLATTFAWKNGRSSSLLPPQSTTFISATPLPLFAPVFSEFTEYLARKREEKKKRGRNRVEKESDKEKEQAQRLKKKKKKRENYTHDCIHTHEMTKKKTKNILQNIREILKMSLKFTQDFIACMCLLLNNNLRKVIILYYFEDGWMQNFHSILYILYVLFKKTKKNKL